MGGHLLKYRLNEPPSEIDLRDVDKPRSHRFFPSVSASGEQDGGYQQVDRSSPQDRSAARRLLSNDQIGIGEIVHRMPLWIDIVDGDENIRAA